MVATVQLQVFIVLYVLLAICVYFALMLNMEQWL